MCLRSSSALKPSLITCPTLHHMPLLVTERGWCLSDSCTLLGSPSRCCLAMCAAQNELHLPVPEGAYPPLASLIHACLAHAHEQRPTFGDITRDLEVRLSDRVLARDAGYRTLSTVAQKDTRA